MDVDVVEESPVTFPAVTICNINPYDTSDQATMNYLNRTLVNKSLSINKIATDSEPAIEQVRSSQALLQASVLADRQLNDSQKTSLGFKINSLLISCYFNNVQCNESDFTWYYTFEFGNCYTFNKKTGSEASLKKNSKPGRYSGLSLELFTGISEIHDILTIEKGVYVSVHNNSQIPLTKFDGVRISPGFDTDISIRRSYQLKKDSPFNDCRLDTATILDDDSEYFKKTVSLSKYSQYLCYEICLQYEFIIKECNCSDPSVPASPNDKTIKFCDTASLLKCVLKVRNKFDETSISSQCAKFCPAECEKMRFTSQLSASQYPTRYYFDIIKDQPKLKNKFSGFSNKKNLSYDTFKESVLMVNIYYGDLSYTSVVESPAYTIDSLLGIIG